MKRDEVRALVSQRRLQFVNGGWVMNDEAAPLVADMLDQTTLGHVWIADTFGVEALPRAGWQIDPFGHAAAQAEMYALMGMDSSWFFCRVHYQDYAHRLQAQALEMLMQPSVHGGGSSSDGSIFGGAIYSDMYGSPPGFGWSDGGGDDPSRTTPL